MTIHDVSYPEGKCNTIYLQETNKHVRTVLKLGSYGSTDHHDVSYARARPYDRVYLKIKQSRNNDPSFKGELEHQRDLYALMATKVITTFQA
jgi:hypothetical protein